LDAIYRWTELIQSSPIAVQRSVHGAIGGAYRTQNITTLELRFHPMKRNRGGERDLDHIIMAATRGLDLAQLEYPKVRAGLILMMDRTFAREQNEVIVEKAIRYAGRGIVGVDYAMSSSSLVRIGALDGDGARGVNARARGHVRRTVRHAGSDMTLAESVR
jgi:adenosine deaminase